MNQELDIEKIIELYVKENKKVKEIAEIFGSSPSTIQRRLKKEGVLKSSGRAPKVDFEIAKKLYLEDDMTMQEVADHLKVSHSTIHQMFKNAGIEKDAAQIRGTYKRSMMNKYGAEHPQYSTEIKEKIIKTNMERYGAPMPLQSKEIMEKTRQSRYKVNKLTEDDEPKYFQEILTADFLYKYFIEENMRRSEIAALVGCAECTVKAMLKKHNIYKDKTNAQKLIEATNLVNLGVKTNMMTDEFKKQSRLTVLEKYGCEYPTQSKEIKNKIKQSNLKKYGYEYAVQAPSIRAKISAHNNDPIIKEKIKSNRRQHFVKQYGENIFHQSLIHIQHIEDWHNFVSWSKNLFEKYGQIDKVFAADYFNVTLGTLNTKIRKNNCNELFKLSTSQIEKEWCNFLDKHNIKYAQHVRDLISLEIDIFIPKINTGIEINPSASHNSTICVYAPEKGIPKDKFYHQNKTMMSYKNNIRLIHIFDWDDPEIIQSLILNEIQSTSVAQKDEQIELYENKSCVIFKDNISKTQMIIKQLEKSNEWLIISTVGYQNILQTMFQKFIEQYSPHNIKWKINSCNENYLLPKNLGFSIQSWLEPNGYWSSIFQRTNQKITNTEQEEAEMLKNGYGLVYDSGAIIFNWKKIIKF